MTSRKQVTCINLSKRKGMCINFPRKGTCIDRPVKKEQDTCINLSKKQSTYINLSKNNARESAIKKKLHIKEKL